MKSFSGLLMSLCLVSSVALGANWYVAPTSTTAVAQYNPSSGTLIVQSTPPTGVSISSSTSDGGTTNYMITGIGSGSNVNLQAPTTDPSGYTFSQWIVNGTAQTSGTKSVTFQMNSGTTAVAIYTLSGYTLTVQAFPATGVNITSSTGDGGTTNYAINNIPSATNVTLTAPATDPTGYTFVQWVVNTTTETAGTKSVTFSMTQNSLALAQYTQGSGTLMVLSSPPAGVAITSSSGQGGTTNYTVTGITSGTNVTLAAPATDPSGYTFSAWIVNGGVQTAGTKSVTFSVTSASTAIAMYCPASGTLSVQSTPVTGVSISSSTSDGGTTNYTVSNISNGTSVNLQAPATDPTGYTFSQWLVNGVSQGAGTKNVTFTMYVGAASSAGTLTNPWSLDYALNDLPSVSNTSLAAGDTVWLLGGTYVPTQVVPQANNQVAWSAKVSGTATAPITYESYTGQWAAIDREWALLNLSYVTFQNLEFYNSLKGASIEVFTLNNNEGPWVHFTLRSNVGVKWINCLIHDVNDAWSGEVTETIRGCIIWYVGWNALEHVCYPNALCASGNIVAFPLNRTFNCSAGPWSTCINNIICGQDAEAGNPNYEAQVDLAFGNSAGEIVTGNTVYDGLYGMPLGAGLAAPGTVISNNIFVSPACVADPGGSYPPLVFQNNMLYNSGTTNENMVYYTSTNNAAWTYNNNQYYCYSGAPAFAINGTYGYSFSQWQSDTGFDSSSTATTGAPTTTTVQVYPNQDQAKRANIAICNWAQSSTVSVNLNQVLNPGDTYSLYNAQNYNAGPIQTGTYNGASISVPMTGLTTAPLLNSMMPNYIGDTLYQAAPLSPTFGAFVVIGQAGTMPSTTLFVEATTPTGVAITSSTGDGGTTNYEITGISSDTNINLVAPSTDPTGYTFSQWIVNGTAETSGTKSISFTMTAATTAVAQYSATLTVQSWPMTGVSITSSTSDGGTTNYTVNNVAYGSSVNLVAPSTDPTGYTFFAWMLNGAAQPAGQKSIAFTMNAATTAVARYLVTLTVQSTPPTGVAITSTTDWSNGCSCGGTTNYSYTDSYGVNVNLQVPATDPNGYTFANWTLNGTNQGNGTKSITFNLTCSITAVANYTGGSGYTLTVESTPPTGVAITSSTSDGGTTNYAIGNVAGSSSVNLVAPATDPTGYTFANWTVNGTSQGAGTKNITFNMPSAATTAIANYTTNTYTLTVQSTPPTGVAITSSGSDGGTTNYTVNNVAYNSSVNLVAPATDPSNYTFSNWTLNGTSQGAGTKNITFNQPAVAVTALANYTSSGGYTLTVQSTPPTGVAITSNTSDGGTTNYTVNGIAGSASVNLVAPGTDPTGYTFANWTLNGTSQGAGTKSITFNMPSAATTAIANYTTNTYTLTVQDNTTANGLVITSSTGDNGTTNYTVNSVSYNSSVNLVAPSTDPSGYTFSEWTLNGTAQTSGTKNITFNMPAAATTAVATYSSSSGYTLTVQTTPVTGVAITSNYTDGGTSNYTITGIAANTNMNICAPQFDSGGAAFEQWIINGTNEGNGNRSISFTMTGNVTALGEFANTLTVQSTPPTGVAITSSTSDGGTTNYTVSNCNPGSSVNLVAPATDPTGYTFSDWTLNGTAQTAGTKNITFNMPAPNTTAIANYTSSGGYTLTVQSTPPTGIVITSSTSDNGTTNYTVNSISGGSSVNLVAPAADPTGYTFANWTLNGTSQGAGTKSITFNMPSAATTALANYTTNTYTLTVESTPITGQTISSTTGDGGATNYSVNNVAYNSSVNLQAPTTDPTGYTFSAWTLNGTSQGAGTKNITFNQPAVAVTAIATYTTNTYTLTVQSTPETGVVITSSTSDNGTTNYTVSSVAYNSSINLVAPSTDPTGYAFSEWTLNGTAQTAGTKSITFNQPAVAVTAIATYTTNTYGLTVQSTPPTGVVITSSTSDNGTTNYTISSVPYNSSVNLVAPATDPTGYTFSEWTLNGTAQTGGVKSITFNMPAGAVTAIATYTASTYTLTVQSTPPTRVSISSTTSDNGTTNYTVSNIAYNASINLQAPATDPTGYTFSKWTLNGTAQTAATKNITFNQPSATVTAIATYTTNTYTLTVQSTPPTGVVISSTTSDNGTTNYTVSSVAYNSSINLQAPATDPTGYTFSDWTLNGTAQTAGTKNITFNQPAVAVTAIATYTTNTYTLTVQSTPPTGVAISSTTSDNGTTNYTVSSVAYNSSINLQAPATDPTGYTFSNWTLNGSNQGGGTKNITFNQPAVAVTAIATYTTNTYGLTVQSTPPTGVVISSTTSDNGTTNYAVSSVAYNSSVNLQAPATDPSGYVFANWTLNATSQGAGTKNITFNMPAGAVTAIANYTPTYVLTVESTPPSSVVITSSGSDGGTTNYTVNVPVSSSPNLVAPSTDPTGYTFSKWTLNSTAQTAGTKNITFTMPAAAVTAIATYTTNTYTLTVQSTPPTGVVISSTTSDNGTTNYTVSSVSYNSSVNLQAPATDPGSYTFSQWTLNGTAQTAGTKNITFTQPAVAVTAIATYTSSTYTLTVQSTPVTGAVVGSSDSDGGTTNYTVSGLAPNANANLVAPSSDPNGTTFSKWTLNGTAQTAGSKDIFFTMTTNITAVAVYTANTFTLTVQSTPPTGLAITSTTSDGGTTNYTVSNVAYLSSVNLVAPSTDPTGYTFSAWTLNGTSQTAGTKNITFAMTPTNLTAVATYTANTYVLTVQSTPSTGVVIGSNDSDGGTTNYTHNISYNSSVNLIAPQTSGSNSFVQWTLNGTSQGSGNRSITWTAGVGAVTAVAQY